MFCELAMETVSVSVNMFKRMHMIDYCNIFHVALQYVSEILDRGTFTRDYGSKQDTVNLDDTKGTYDETKFTTKPVLIILPLCKWTTFYNIKLSLAVVGHAKQH